MKLLGMRVILVLIKLVLMGMLGILLRLEILLSI
jgi:hypothetical protein